MAALHFGILALDPLAFGLAADDERYQTMFLNKSAAFRGRLKTKSFHLGRAVANAVVGAEEDRFL